MPKSMPSASPPPIILLKDLIQLQKEAIGKSTLYKNKSSRVLGGQYASRFRGRGMDFEESRAYLPGDDIRAIDWRVTARTNQTHTKIYTEEKERPVLIAIDMGNSMQFGTKVTFKSVIAAKAAALLGWKAVKAGDRVGALLFTTEQHREIKPKRGKTALLQCFGLLTKQTPSKNLSPTELQASIKRIHAIAKHGYLIYFISDFQQLDATSQKGLTQIAQHNEVVLVQISDPIEEQLPKKGSLFLTNGTQKTKIESTNQHTQAQLQQFTQKIREPLVQLSKSASIHWLALRTDQNVATTLRDQLR